MWDYNKLAKDAWPACVTPLLVFTLLMSWAARGVQVTGITWHLWWMNRMNELLVTFMCIWMTWNLPSNQLTTFQWIQMRVNLSKSISCALKWNVKHNHFPSCKFFDTILNQHHHFFINNLWTSHYCHKNATTHGSFWCFTLTRMLDSAPCNDSWDNQTRRMILNRTQGLLYQMHGLF